MAFTIQIGQSAPDFSLPAPDGKTYGLGDLAKVRILVVFFICNHCPFVVGADDPGRSGLGRLAKGFRPRVFWQDSEPVPVEKMILKSGLQNRIIPETLK